MSKKNDSHRGMRHAAIYYRVSTDKQDLDSQRNAVEEMDGLVIPKRTSHVE